GLAHNALDLAQLENDGRLALVDDERAGADQEGYDDESDDEGKDAGHGFRAPRVRGCAACRGCGRRWLPVRTPAPESRERRAAPPSRPASPAVLVCRTADRATGCYCASRPSPWSCSKTPA